MILISIDPGVAIGIAIKNNNQYFTCTLTEDDVIEGKLRELIASCDLIIYEDFVGYASHQMKVSKDGFYTVRIIGRIIEQAAVLNKPIFKQAAQNRLAFMHRAKQMIKNGEVATIRPTRHEPDALAHLLCFEFNQAQKAKYEERIKL
jgi:hypothetical protein